MFWNKKKNKRVEIELRAPKKRRSFFEKKEDDLPDPLFPRMIFRLLVFVFIGATAYVLFFSPFLEVKTVSLRGIAELKYEDVYRKINENFSGKYLYFIPKNNLILISKNKTERNLLESFKKISDVNIRKNFPDGIVVEITEREALLVWCANTCYIIDNNGYAYTEADFASEEIRQNNLLSIRDDSGKPVDIGRRVLGEDYIDFIISLKEEVLRGSGITIANEYRTGSRIAEEVKVRTEEGWEIYFSSRLPIENSVRTLKTFLDKEIDQEKRSKLEYIDLRAENKVYYKFKEEEKEENKDQENTENNSENKEEKE